MREVKHYPICRAELEAVINALGMTSVQASAELGFGATYLCQSYSRGWLPEYAVRLIKARFGIDYEQYKKHEKPVVEETAKEEPKEEATSSDVLAMMLEEMRGIRAELEALRKAFE